jgi:hypothetical protein
MITKIILKAALVNRTILLLVTVVKFDIYFINKEPVLRKESIYDLFKFDS